VKRHNKRREQSGGFTSSNNRRRQREKSFTNSNNNAKKNTYYEDTEDDNDDNYYEDDHPLTTIRPLDGFLERRVHFIPVLPTENDNNNNNSEEGTTEGEDKGEIKGVETIEYILRPTVQSYSRQSQYYKLSSGGNTGSSSSSRSNSSSSTTSTISIANAHYAKSLRMLSSPFDKLVNGGNAIPYDVYDSSYRQSIVGDNDGERTSKKKSGGGRGEGFVKLDDYGSGSSGRSTLVGDVRVVSSKKKKSRQGSGGWRNRNRNRRRREQKKNGDGDNDEKDALNVIHLFYDMTYDYIMDTFDWLCEILGVEMDGFLDDDENAEYYDEDNGNNNGIISMLQRKLPFLRTKRSEEEIYSWSDTRVGRQLIWMYVRVKSLFDREEKSSSSSTNYQDSYSTSSSSSSEGSKSTESPPTSSSFFLSKEDELAREGLYHLEKAADLGHSEAQRMVANSLASGILPISDHGLIRRIAALQYAQQQSSGNGGGGGGNWTEILRESSLEVPDDFSSGGEQLARAIILWHVSAMDGNVESAMALGYRHLYSATGGVSTSLSDIVEGRIAPKYNPSTGKGRDQHGSNPTSHYGVLGTCETALGYYEAAANGVMDSLESGPTKGKINPPLDEHRLAEIYMHGGASVSLQGHNKPDEIEEALQYYRMLASRNHSPEPDLGAALTIANFYYMGLRGVKQDLRLALKYYEICGDYNHWEGGGQAGLMHFWGVGMSPEERDLKKAYTYFQQGTPGGLEGCHERARARRKALNKKDPNAEEISLCDKNSINGMGLMYLFGVDGLVKRNVGMARSWWELCKDMGDSDCQYNYGMLRLGWMVTELNDLKSAERFAAKDAKEPKTEEVLSGSVKTGDETSYMAYRKAKVESTLGTYTGPSLSDYNVAVQEFSRAAAKGHLQAKHKLAMLYSTGVDVPKKEGKFNTAVAQSCTNALRYYKSIADGGDTISRRNRAAWKQYNAGDYESSLRNYLATAETGSETGQVNAAFLLEQGHCLGLTRDSCTRASVRLWRAAARQGNLEACLRVGDYYYYGRMKKSRGGDKPPILLEDGNSKFLYEQEDLEGKSFYFSPGPYRWARYILYPEELVQLVKKWTAKYLNSSEKEGQEHSETQTCSIDDEASGTCAAVEKDTNEDDGDDHMAIAAQYYRKAAEEHKSARANFNLGFMHEWGLGLTQDFPLAKRHYDLAGQEASIASSIALWAMSLHQMIVKFNVMLEDTSNV
ncbi:hypothetical protein ACHAWC_007347, partial [Mediolabrus comicus]